jgi:hypothetical protein
MNDIGICEMAGLFASSLAAEWWGKRGEVREGDWAGFIACRGAKSGRKSSGVKAQPKSAWLVCPRGIWGKKMGVSGDIPMGSTCQ